MHYFTEDALQEPYLLIFEKEYSSVGRYTSGQRYRCRL